MSATNTTGPLDYRCPTCRAEPGQACDKRGNLRRGGPSHLTRVDRFIRATNRSDGQTPNPTNHAGA